MNKTNEFNKSLSNISKKYILENGIDNTDKQSKKSSIATDKNISNEAENTTKQKWVKKYTKSKYGNKRVQI